MAAGDVIPPGAILLFDVVVVDVMKEGQDEEEKSRLEEEKRREAELKARKQEEKRREEELQLRKEEEKRRLEEKRLEEQRRREEEERRQQGDRRVEVEEEEELYSDEDYYYYEDYASSCEQGELQSQVADVASDTLSGIIRELHNKCCPHARLSTARRGAAAWRGRVIS